jgi:hypothetical protein
MTSEVPLTKALYPSLIEEWAMLCCFPNFQDISVCLKKQDIHM